MRECRTYGSVRGVRSNAHSYRNSFYGVTPKNGDVVWKRSYNELFLTLRVRMLRPWERL